MFWAADITLDTQTGDDHAMNSKNLEQYDKTCERTCRCRRRHHHHSNTWPPRSPGLAEILCDWLSSL